MTFIDVPRAREYFPGMGSAVADRTINRLVDGRRETWAEVAERVALGNSLLDPRGAQAQAHERGAMRAHLRQASLLMSGRHLQHGDASQPTRNGEIMTNCLDGSTSILTMEHGPVAIEKIAGQVVTVIAGDGVPRRATINEHGEQELFDITFRQNTTGPLPGVMPVVRATSNHRWKLSSGEITENLRVGDIIAATKAIQEHDPRAVVHGLIFGDGTAHKARHDHLRRGVSQERTYASIRVCKSDAVRDEIHRILDDAGYGYTTPPHADGDRTYYLGKFPHAKELPFCCDPEYIAGFIYGWWLADGSKTVNHAYEISTSDEASIAWLKEHAAYAGYVATMHRIIERKPGDVSYANGRPLNLIRIRQNLSMKVHSITPAGRAKVYCPEEPVTSTFVLSNGLLTGNCATAATTFLLFYLLLNGSGVGRAYDDALIQADFNHMPVVVQTIGADHADVVRGLVKGFESPAEALRRLEGSERPVAVFRVPDSREGWEKAVEVIERMAFARRRDEILMLDYSDVRPMGAPIAGMQNRPASGPGPIMDAIAKLAGLRDKGHAPWEAAMYADHFMSECVLVGGARRAARMATKSCWDASIFKFIRFKRTSGCWSSNNSVLIDAEFRTGAQRAYETCFHLFATVPHSLEEAEVQAMHMERAGYITEREAHAFNVLIAIAEASYFDGTGEPGIINVDRLAARPEGIDSYVDGLFAESAKLKLDTETVPLMKALAVAAKDLQYMMITNPCGEICLLLLGGYCVIADVVPFYARSDDDAEDAFRVATRALIRTNLMDFLYAREVRRTNRIGVGFTGFHEWAYKRFGYTWQDIIDETKSQPLWQMMARFKRAVVDEAERYAIELGVEVPHTNTTVKPAGTTSKLFGLTEGAHLPSMRKYLRWVQFRNDDPLVREYEAKGYPVRKLVSYSGTTIVGFPTAPTICELDGGAWVVTAAEATPAEQYAYLRLLEKYWIRGVEQDGVTPLAEDTGNQVSYTLKYSPDKVNFEEFLETLVDGQFSIKCCSVMPQVDATSYEYQPEEPLSDERYAEIVARISDAELRQEIGREHVDCSTGACPVDFEAMDLEDRKVA